MSVSYKIWDFPTLAIRAQLFSAAGQAFDGGFTSGGVRILSPEPGGRSLLELELSLQTKEWAIPFTSWLMSKTNGDIFRVPLVRTPQLVETAELDLDESELFGVPWAAEGLYPQSTWDNGQNWSYGALPVDVTVAALEGTSVVTVEMGDFGSVLTYGHVIGNDDNAYIIDDIEYDGTLATITVKPPFRKDIAIGDTISLRPYFLGTITNGSEIRTLYEALNNGHIQPARVVFSEVVI